MSNRLSSRLARLLNLVPYFIANPGISPAEAAEELGVSTTQLMTDLNQLWVCGLPGYGPGDLIDLSFSEESIEVTFSAGIDRPLRLTSTEATALLIACGPWWKCPAWSIRPRRSVPSRRSRTQQARPRHEPSVRTGTHRRRRTSPKTR